MAFWNRWWQQRRARKLDRRERDFLMSYAPAPGQGTFSPDRQAEVVGLEQQHETLKLQRQALAADADWD